MRVKSNIQLSDFELRQITAIFNEAENPDAELYNAFPHIKHKIEGDVLYFGAPPWDLTHEITI